MFLGVLALCDNLRTPASSLVVVRHKVRQLYISRTVWPTVVARVRAAYTGTEKADGLP